MLGLSPVIFSYAAWVTSVSPSQNPLVRVILRVGYSSAKQSESPGEQPEIKVPGGIQRYRSPSLGFTFTSPGLGEAVWKAITPAAKRTAAAISLLISPKTATLS